jgi:DNA-binding XRE family transcriptional regulator
VTSRARISHLIPAIVDLLKESREAKGLSKKRLAEVASISRTAIILMEKHQRQPSLELVLRIADGLGLSLATIITHAEERVRIARIPPP